jgi:processive 1,2-diacylglycerol beta-glucosyltransferase
LFAFKNLFQLVVIAGKDKERQKDLKSRFKSLGFEGKVVGFVDNIDEYMKTADLLISKAGGLTTTEAITLGLPMLIVRPTPGQEDGNTEFLTKAKAGVYIKDIRKIAEIVKKILRDPNKLNEMRRNSKKLAKPKANETIIREMLSLFKKSPTKSVL